MNRGESLPRRNRSIRLLQERPNLTQEKGGALVLRWPATSRSTGTWRQTGGSVEYGGNLLTGKICQSHSLKVSYSDQQWVSLKVTFWHERVETKGVLSKSTSDFRHLGLWHFECDS